MKTSSLAFVLATTALSFPAFAAPTNYSVQNDLSGVTTVAPTANYGSGVVYGDIDTGITPQWIGFTPTYNGQGVFNIDIVNSGVCLNGSCTSGGALTDGNGHGTFTASEIVGGVQTAGANMSGVARAGTLISVQVLDASGSGTGTDIANGIQYAADHGAQVLNLSLGPGGTATQQAAFYKSMASAINYAASKGVYVVFAGGNDSKTFVGGQKITGFSDAAIQHLVFVGSTNNGNNIDPTTTKLSAFSNTPGTGTFVSTSGKVTLDRNIWLMANGGDIKKSFFFGSTITDPIWGASNSNSGQCVGYSCVTQMVGTSMAAPQVTGAIGLLLQRWPVLITNGMAAQILEQSATDLGNQGIDTTYGRGFLNMVKAFQASGTLSVNTSGGKTVSVNNLSGSMVSGGALGNVASIRSSLSHYTAFDQYQRDFTLNLSGLLSTKKTISNLASTASAAQPTVISTHFADGSQLSFGNSELSHDPIDNPIGASADNNWFMSFTDGQGSTFAAGYGFPASASFAGALWGIDSTVADEAASLGVSSALTDLAQGGQFTAFGTQIDKDTRVAFAWTQTQADNGLMNSDWSAPDASAFTGGITGNMTDYWKAGLTFGLLNEQNGMLGTRYAANGPLSLGEQHQSMSVGLSSAFALGHKLDLLLDAAIVRADGTNLADGILTDISPMYARSFGASLVQRDTFEKDDHLSLAMRSPLTVYSASANLAMTSVDGNGIASTTKQRVSLKPDGNELDFVLSYAAPIRKNLQWNAALEGRKDADNIAGANDTTARVGMRFTF